MSFERSASPRIRRVGVALVLSAGLLLSGCGLLPSPSLPPVPTPTAQPSQPADGAAGGQAEQCAQLMTDVQAIAVDVARVPELLGAGNLLEAGALIGGITERVGGLQTRVTDPELLERIDEIQTGWNALVEDAQGSLTSGDTSGIDRAIAGVTELTEQVTALQEFCAGTE